VSDDAGDARVAVPSAGGFRAAADRRFFDHLADEIEHQAEHPEALAPGVLTDAEADMITGLACRLFTRAQRERAADQLTMPD
jgi:hypothetical protein